jgi:hypothetical protein
MTALAAALAAAPAAAQACAGSVAPADSSAAQPARAPDVRIVASATIAELRFRTEPQTQVRATGCPGAESVVTTLRQNLPDPVQPGATYRDVRVGVEIRAWLNLECLPALAAADPALCAPVRIETDVTPPPGEPAPANPPLR